MQHCSSEDEPLKSRWLASGEFDSETAAPTLAEDMVAMASIVEAKTTYQVVQFVDKEAGLPKGSITSRLAEMCGFRAADLIVENDGNFVMRPKVTKGLDILMARSRTAMQDNYGRRLEMISIDLVVCFAGLIPRV
jgi:hypothetical protein